VLAKAFLQDGWATIPYDPLLRQWVDQIRPAAINAVKDPDNGHWMRCQGTWFAGVNVLPNDTTGQVGQSGPLQGRAVQVLADLGLPVNDWDRAQISVTYPGYPQQSPEDSDAGFRFRRDRDAAHVDGLLPIGPDRQRMLREPHAFVLGIPLSETTASPLVTWRGSHQIIRKVLGDVLRQYPSADWPNIDLTSAYHTARREIFATCERVEIHAKPGAAYILHRLALHGVAPWEKSVKAPPEGRMIAYFRPESAKDITSWIADP